MPVPVFISMASDQLLSPAEWAVTVGWHRLIEYRYGGVCVCGGGVHAFARVRASVRACVMCLQYTTFDPG